jgi:serpin B
MRDVKLYLPKFSFSSNLMLAEKLIAMGMPDAFDPGTADFTGMYDPNSSPGAGLHISHVVHQAFVAVDEEGTEAAAATGVVVEIVSMPEMMRVDRPFIFLIRDRQTGAILFVGRCTDPSITE